MIDETPNPSDAVAANRAAWDESAPLHRASAAWGRLVAGFAKPGFTSFDGQHAVLKQALELVGLDGKHVAQVCCNNGRETISLKRLGADRAVGFDQSEAFIAQARELAGIAGESCVFVVTDANAIPAEHHGQFDLVLITIGVFGWMPDMKRFMRNVAALLRPGGRLLVYEEHPVVNIFEVRSERPFEAVNSYFQKHPFFETRAIVYDDSPAPDVTPHYWFVHPLSAVFTAMLESGFRIEAFQEYGNNISSTEFDRLEKADPILPLSYILQALKAG